MVGLILGALQTRARNDGRLDIVSRLVQRLVEAPAVAVAHAADSTSDFFVGITHAASLRRRIAMLESQQLAQADYAAHVERLESEIDDLRKLQHFASLPGRTAVPAEVSGIFAYDNRIALSVGSDKGIQPGMPVVSGRGLLAIIQTVASDHSEALLLVSPVTKIGAIGLRNPPPAGLLRGEGGGVLYVDFLDPNAIVQNGDEIVTSGFSDRIPPDIPIGRIIGIEENVDFGTKRAVVFPWASLGAAREVYILK